MRDKSKVSVKLEKWCIKNLYEIIDYFETSVKFEKASIKLLAMVESIKPIKDAIVDALKVKEEKTKNLKKSKQRRKKVWIV